MPLTVTADNTAKLAAAVARLLKSHVLVGIPDSTADRQPEPGEPKPASNAVIGYVQEFGDPEKNIPPRPFLVPGVEGIQSQITSVLQDTAEKALSGGTGAVDAGLRQVGLAAETAVKQKMQSGPFAPLSERTIRERAERRYKDTGKLVGAKANREARQFLKLQGQGVPQDILHSAGLAQPLIDTRSLIKSITHVIRDKSGS